MSQRPKLKIEHTSADKFIELLTFLLVVQLWIYAVISYSKLPDIIPTHFNFSGKADSFGAKASLFTLPTIATIMWVALTLLNKVPHIFNYPSKITVDNALQHYTIATKMMRYLKLVVVVIFCFAVYQTVSAAQSGSDSIGKLFLLLCLVSLALPIIYFFWQSGKLSRAA
ncbi:MAG: hypothetical protein RL660_808 [Bacteroidota bacterium]|jgi:uncharacterized membrane protein